ncbi:MAG: 4Fe-4S binding protein [Planctomycetes bacterium]|nr:4Fe-4S binding protein [Planctomycetota bacterium]
MGRSVRKIVRIDEDKCNGCGLCVPSCAEGAIRIINGKAKLVSEVYCDGLGACLGHCPQDAITIEERAAEAFDEQAVEAHLSEQPAVPPSAAAASACPGAAMRVLQPHAHAGGGCPGAAMRTMKPAAAQGAGAADAAPPPSQLGQWPVQLHLVAAQAPFLAESDLVVCADCVPFAVSDFHSRYLAGRAVVVGCPKLDDLEAYHRKLHDIFVIANPRRITVLRMEVPCCGGLAQAAIDARTTARPDTPLEVHIIGIGGGITVQHVPSPEA